MKLKGEGASLRPKQVGQITQETMIYFQAFNAVRIETQHKRITIHLTLQACNAVRCRSLIRLRIEDHSRFVNIEGILGARLQVEEQCWHPLSSEISRFSVGTCS